MRNFEAVLLRASSVHAEATGAVTVAVSDGRQWRSVSARIRVGSKKIAMYCLEHALALVELDFAADTELYTLRDSAQESQLNAALRLTMPSIIKKGSEKTRGEEQVAFEARVERETMPAPAPKRQRGAPTD